MPSTTSANSPSPHSLPIFYCAGPQDAFSTYLERLAKGNAVNAGQDMEDLLSCRQRQAQALELQKKAALLIREAEQRRTMIVQRNALLVAKLAAKAATTTNLPAEDLFQYGIIGLLEGLEKYDPSATGGKGGPVKVMSYCYHYIDKRIKEHAEKNRPAISVPHEIHRLQTKIHKTRPAVAKWLQVHQDEVSIEQIILYLADRNDYNIHKYWPELIGDSPDLTVLTRLVSGLLIAYTPVAGLHVSSDEEEEAERQLSDDGDAERSIIRLMDKKLTLSAGPQNLGGLVEALADPSLDTEAITHARVALGKLGKKTRSLIAAAFSNGSIDYKSEAFLFLCEEFSMHPLAATRLVESGITQLYAAAGYLPAQEPDLFSGV